MAVLTTKELFDAYFSDKEPTIVRKTRPQVDRLEVYKYEEKIGKQLVDMNVNELFDMMCTFKNQRAHEPNAAPISITTFKKIVSAYRNIFDMYIDKYELIKNPFYNAKFKGIRGDEFIVNARGRFTYSDVEETIDKLHRIYDEDRADYYELLIRLFYEGFAESQEIVSVKEEDINFRRNEVRLPGRIITLSNKCMTLLKKIHNLDQIKIGFAFGDMVSWHGSYIKLCVKAGGGDEFQNVDLVDAGRKINNAFTACISKPCGIDIRYRKLYLLGFYDFLVKKYGEEYTNSMIKSSRVQQHIDDLTAARNEYGLTITNLTYLKHCLIQFT